MSDQARIITVCDSLATYLNGKQAQAQTPPAPAINLFAPFTFVAYRDYAPIFQLEKMGPLTVVVCPRGKTTTMYTKSTAMQDDGVDIGILCKPANLDISSPKPILDPLMLLVQQIHDVVAFEDFSGASWIKTESAPLYSAEHLREWKQFTSVLRLTLKEGLN